MCILAVAADIVIAVVVVSPPHFCSCCLSFSSSLVFSVPLSLLVLILFAPTFDIYTQGFVLLATGMFCVGDEIPYMTYIKSGAVLKVLLYRNCIVRWGRYERLTVELC